MPDASKAALQALAARHVPDGIDLVLGGPAFSPQTARAAGGRYLGADLAKGTATLRKLAR
jgi:hypothetical protein